VVIGIGGLGHVALQILRATADARVVAVDLDQHRLDGATELGAHETVRAGAGAVEQLLELTDGYGADAVFDLVGVQDTVDLATGSIAPDGALRFVGLGGGGFRMAADPDTSVLPWGVDVRRSYAGTRADLRSVVDLAARGEVRITARHYPLEDGPQAFADLEHGRVEGRAILVP
jgi:propanol-preferring alcohol dehydrogenase